MDRLLTTCMILVALFALPTICVLPKTGLVVQNPATGQPPEPVERQIKVVLSTVIVLLTLSIAKAYFCLRMLAGPVAAAPAEGQAFLDWVVSLVGKGSRRELARVGVTLLPVLVFVKLILRVMNAQQIEFDSRGFHLEVILLYATFLVADIYYIVVPSELRRGARSTIDVPPLRVCEHASVLVLWSLVSYGVLTRAYDRWVVLFFFGVGSFFALAVVLLCLIDLYRWMILLTMSGTRDNGTSVAPGGG